MILKPTKLQSTFFDYGQIQPVGQYIHVDRHIIHVLTLYC